MSSENKSSKQPHRSALSTLKGHLTDADTLNEGEELAQTFKDRSMTAEERDKALSIGRAMNAGTEPEMSLTPKRLLGFPKP